MIKTPKYRLKSGIVFITAIFFTAVFLLSQIVLSQIVLSQSITWQRTYDGPFVVDYGYEILPAPNNEFYLVGYLQNQNNYAYVLKLNQFGDTLWSKLIFAGSHGRVYSAANSTDGGCVFAVELSQDSLLLVKLDPNGNIIWAKGSNNGSTIWEIKSVTDGGFIACGNASLVGYGYIAKFNAEGDMVWHRFYQGGSGKGFFSILEIIGEGYLLTGYIDLRPAIDSGKALLTKIDYSGNIITENYFGPDKLSIGKKITKIGNDIFIGGDCFLDTEFFNIFILKISDSFELLQLKIFQHSIYSDEFFDDLEIINSNKYIICSRLDTNIPVIQTHAKVTIIDSTFNIIRQKLMTSYGYSSFTSVLPLQNGDLVFGGTFEYGTVWYERGFDYYAARTDSNLNLPELPPISINPVSAEVPKSFAVYQNYPNPFNPVTSIRYEIPKDADVSVKVFDLLGKEVFRMTEFKKAGSYEVIFNGSNFASGLYFYSFEANGFKDTKKMVLIK